MSMREDIEDMKKELNEVRNESFAMELLQDQRKQNKRQFIIILVLIFALFMQTCYLFYLLNDIDTEYVTTTTENYDQDISDNGDITNSYIVNGGDING